MKSRLGRWIGKQKVQHAKAGMVRAYLGVAAGLRRATCLAACFAVAAAPATAHGAATCAQMAQGIAVMQHEVDGTRFAAQHDHVLAKTAHRNNPRLAAHDEREAQQLTQRADVEQMRIDGWRQSYLHCSTSDDDGD